MKERPLRSSFCLGLVYMNGEDFKIEQDKRRATATAITGLQERQVTTAWIAAQEAGA